MKIIHLCNYFQPQLGYQEYFLAREHARMGHDVTVVTSDRYFPFPDYENTVGKILGKRIVSSGISKLDGFRVIRLRTIFEFSSRVLLAGLSETVRSIGPDIVVCHGMASFNSQIIINLKKKYGFRLIYDDHMLYAVENRSIAARLFYKIYDFKRINKYADKLIAVANECRKFMIENYKLPHDKIEIIPLGADIDKFKFDKKSRDDFRKLYGIEDGAIVVTYTGKLMYEKAPHNIIIALEAFKEKLPDRLVLLFVGNVEKSYKEYFNMVKKKIEGKTKIVEVPMTENDMMPSVYSASDMAVWPVQPTASMIEAASCSIPIIGTDRLAERYKNENGIPVKENDIDDLASAILRLVNDEKLRATMGKRGRELVEKEMSWRKIAERFIDF